MNGPVAAALGNSPVLGAKFEAFRKASHAALGEKLTAQVRHAVARVHGLDAAPGDRPNADGAAADLPADSAWLTYARRIPFEHTAITDEDAAAVVAELGEDRFVAFSVVTALADAECRAAKVNLPGLAGAV